MTPTESGPPKGRFQNLRGRLSFDELDAILEPLVRRLVGVDPEAVLRTHQEGGGLLRLVAEHLSTSKDFFDAREAMETRPFVLLRVRPGDWVTVHGLKLRIGKLSRDGQVLTERLDREGEVLSAVWIDGRGLAPEPPPGDLAAHAGGQDDEVQPDLTDPFRRVRAWQELHVARVRGSHPTPPPC